MFGIHQTKFGKNLSSNIILPRCKIAQNVGSSGNFEADATKNSKKECLEASTIWDQNKLKLYNLREILIYLPYNYLNV